MIWWLIGTWFALVCVLSFTFGRLGWLSDEDWGIFVSYGIAFWPIILTVILAGIVLIIPLGTVFLFVRFVGIMGEKSKGK